MNSAFVKTSICPRLFLYTSIISFIGTPPKAPRKAKKKEKSNHDINKNKSSKKTAPLHKNGGENKRSAKDKSSSKKPGKEEEEDGQKSKEEIIKSRTEIDSIKSKEDPIQSKRDKKKKKNETHHRRSQKDRRKSKEDTESIKSKEDMEIIKSETETDSVESTEDTTQSKGDKKKTDRRRAPDWAGFTALSSPISAIGDEKEKTSERGARRNDKKKKEEVEEEKGTIGGQDTGQVVKTTVAPISKLHNKKGGKSLRNPKTKERRRDFENERGPKKDEIENARSADQEAKPTEGVESERNDKRKGEGGSADKRNININNQNIIINMRSEVLHLFPF